MRAILVLLFFCSLHIDSVCSVASLKIDNELLEAPKLECLADSIIVSVKTKQPFFGRLFVKGQSHLPECSIRGSGPTDTTPNQKSLHVLFENCFLRRQRVFSPQRGVIVTAIVVVSFHPFFLTESDGAYRLQCIYLDSRQSLSAVLNVQGTQPTTTALSPLPTCKYEILEGGPGGRPIPLASVGAKVYHLWSCQAAEPSKYCSLIHSCIAEDGNGVNVQILDERGCTKDSVLLQNLEYLDDLRAGQYATVYKFADRESIFFKCEVMVTQKQEGQQCPRPVCANTAGSNMAHFEQAPPNISSTSVAFDRRVLALRKALRRRIRDALSLDVLTELDVSEIVPAENDSVDSLSCRYSLSALAFTIPLWFIPVIRFR